ncbi:MAG: class I SAM-dependent methyltransferase [Anaerolineales bacterium]|nr:class I SAM-dependent methyltransferase [Anaerolineales bacterium]
MVWREADSQAFIDYGRYFVPERELQIKLFCDLVPGENGRFDILELCCGAGLLAEALLTRFPTVIVHGYDGSPEMLTHAKQQLADYGDHFRPRLFDLADSSWRATEPTYHAVVSSLAVHHLDGEQKQQLFADVYRMLLPGGVFLLADVVQPVSEAGTAVAADMWDEATRQRALQLDGTLDGFAYFQDEQWNMYRYPELPESSIDKPSSIFDQLKWLEKAGFGQVDLFWMKAGHALFGGSK